MVGQVNLDFELQLIDVSEEIDFPLKITDGKGKEKEPSLLRIGLTWIGRQTRVEELGLPTKAPGKMFRTDITGIPMSLEEREARKPKPKITGTFPYASGGHRARGGGLDAGDVIGSAGDLIGDLLS